MLSVKTSVMVISILILAIALIYSIHSLYITPTKVITNSSMVPITKYNDLLNNYTNLLIKYTALLQKLNECMTSESPGHYQGALNHREVVVSNLIINATIPITQCNGYTFNSVKQVSLETNGPGYLLITYRLSNPQVISGQVSYYVYVMAQALPSIPITAAYTYESTTYAYEAGQYGQLIIPVLPNSTYAINIGFVCYVATYYPPTNAGVIVNGEIPEVAIINVTYVW
ncbi:MAG: hypothetical protein ACP5GY_02090 [Vulcanisaeta sp.]